MFTSLVAMCGFVIQNDLVQRIIDEGFQAKPSDDSIQAVTALREFAEETRSCGSGSLREKRNRSHLSHLARSKSRPGQSG